MILQFLAFCLYLGLLWKQSVCDSAFTPSIKDSLPLTSLRLSLFALLSG